MAHNRSDPTHTKSLRKRYARKLRGGYRDTNTLLRQGVGEEDALRLAPDALARDMPSFQFTTDPRKHQAFMDWLRRQLEQDVLTLISRNGNIYIRRAYEAGVRHADRALRREGVTIPQPELSRIFNAPVHFQTVQMLYTRNFEALKGINEAVAKDISRTLSEGFTQGWNPRKMARKLTDRVDAVGIHRATVLARTEVVNAHAHATLNRFEEAGIEEVSGRAEWSTADDERVCSICRPMDGEVFTIAEARGKIPAHVQCRCAWLPVIE